MKKIKFEGEFNYKKILMSFVILLLANILIFTTIWVLNKYDAIRLDQFLYQMKSTSVGLDRGLTKSIVFMVGMTSVITTILESILGLLISGKVKVRKVELQYKNLFHLPKLNHFINKRFLEVSLLVLVTNIVIFSHSLDVLTYLKTTTTDSKFIEENYVDPRSVKITFPKTKRNLIYIYLESMESVYADSTVRPMLHNYIPELTVLAQNNINFSNTLDKVGGALPYAGTTWTAASMVSQTSGVTVKVPILEDKYGDDKSYLPNLINLGDILEANGYNQTVLMGSDARFADRDIYFKDHGNYHILDINELKRENRLDPDYFIWWGFEDEKLISFAKEELARLASLGEPFNFTMLTADTHFPDGLMCSDCPNTYESQYANVLACSSKRIYDFINYLEKQPYYDNTTIIISGDHLTMDPNFLDGIDENYVRTTYNTIINAPITPVKEKMRLFGAFDMFPTTLASLNVSIEGDKLGLGTNLFSDKPTLSELYGFEVLDEELQKKSRFYDETFFNDKKLNYLVDKLN